MKQGNTLKETKHNLNETYKVIHRLKEKCDRERKQYKHESGEYGLYKQTQYTALFKLFTLWEEKAGKLTQSMYQQEDGSAHVFSLRKENTPQGRAQRFNSTLNFLRKVSSAQDEDAIINKMLTDSHLLKHLSQGKKNTTTQRKRGDMEEVLSDLQNTISYPVAKPPRSERLPHEIAPKPIPLEELEAYENSNESATPGWEKYDKHSHSSAAPSSSPVKENKEDSKKAEEQPSAPPLSEEEKAQNARACLEVIRENSAFSFSKLGTGVSFFSWLRGKSQDLEKPKEKSLNQNPEEAGAGMGKKG